MPIYEYACDKCAEVFDELRYNPTDAERKTARCPSCCGTAHRSYRFQTFASPSVSTSSELMEDSEPYRDMHYYEKKGEWEKAAKAAEGVSDFARNKFLQKAQNKEKPTK